MEKKTEPETAKTLHPKRTRSQHADPREGSPGEPSANFQRRLHAQRAGPGRKPGRKAIQNHLGVAAGPEPHAGELADVQPQDRSRCPAGRTGTALIPKPDRERRKDRREEEGCSRSPSHTRASQRRAPSTEAGGRPSPWPTRGSSWGRADRNRGGG